MRKEHHQRPLRDSPVERMRTDHISPASCHWGRGAICACASGQPPRGPRLCTCAVPGQRQFPAAGGAAPPFRLAGSHHGTCVRLCLLRPGLIWGGGLWASCFAARSAPPRLCRLCLAGRCPHPVLGWNRAARAAVRRARLAIGQGHVRGWRRARSEPSLLVLYDPRSSLLVLGTFSFVNLRAPHRARTSVEGVTVGPLLKRRHLV